MLHYLCLSWDNINKCPHERPIHCHSASEDRFLELQGFPPYLPLWIPSRACRTMQVFWEYTQASPACLIWWPAVPYFVLSDVQENPVLLVDYCPRGHWVQIRGSNPACVGIFQGSSHTSDLKVGTPVATLSGAWRYRVSAGTDWPGFSTLWLGEMESWICNFYLSVAVRKLACADPSLRYTSMLLGR